MQAASQHIDPTVGRDKQVVAMNIDGLTSSLRPPSSPPAVRANSALSSFEKHLGRTAAQLSNKCTNDNTPSASRPRRIVATRSKYRADRGK
mmetsp:Transcript_24796/g.62357  ORF Transcript_24796/g.62357 Transcript_24796/m.62357 type:complete len:91 (-) Transcript_24796:352-624(-)